MAFTFMMKGYDLDELKKRIKDNEQRGFRQKGKINTGYRTSHIYNSVKKFNHKLCQVDEIRNEYYYVYMESIKEKSK